MPVIDHHALVEKNKKLSEENKKLKGFVNEVLDGIHTYDDVRILGVKYELMKNNKKTFK